MTPSRIEPATSRLVAHCLNQPRHYAIVCLQLPYVCEVLRSVIAEYFLRVTNVVITSEDKMPFNLVYWWSGFSWICSIDRWTQEHGKSIKRGFVFLVVRRYDSVEMRAIGGLLNSLPLLEVNEYGVWDLAGSTLYSQLSTTCHVSHEIPRVGTRESQWQSESQAWPSQQASI